MSVLAISYSSAGRMASNKRSAGLGKAPMHGPEEIIERVLK